MPYIDAILKIKQTLSQALEVCFGKFEYTDTLKTVYIIGRSCGHVADAIVKTTR